MRTFGFVALAVLAVSAAAEKVTERDGLPVVYNYKDGDKCPAEDFYNDCNVCGCLEDGHSAACTKMACPPQLRVRRSAEDKLPTVADYKEGDKCPADVFYSDCNICRCAENGNSAACTTMACPSRSSKRLLRALLESNIVEVVYAPNYKEGDKCPAKYFNDGCNNCVCADDGVTAGCNLMFCEPSESK